MACGEDRPGRAGSTGNHRPRSRATERKNHLYAPAEIVNGRHPLGHPDPLWIRYCAPAFSTPSQTASVNSGTNSDLQCRRAK